MSKNRTKGEKKLLPWFMGKKGETGVQPPPINNPTGGH